MPDTKITALAAITTVDPAADVLPIVDISDTSMAASGTTKKITSNQILGSGGTATLASATITGALAANADTTLGTASKSTNTNLNFSSDLGTQRIYIDRGTRSLVFQDVTSSIENYRIAGITGVHTWSVGGSTAMTLNASGLGVGVGPGYKLDVRTAPATASIEGSRISDATRTIISGQTGATYSYQGIGANQNVIYASGSRFDIVSDTQNLFLRTGTAAYVLLDTSGNVGIGVTPSAWNSTFKALQMGLGGSAYSQTGFNSVYLASNTFVDSGGNTKYINTDKATYYRQYDGIHSWFNVASGTAGNAFTATQAMTLDASGNLLVGTTASGGQNGFCVLRPLSAAVVATTTETAHNFGALTGTTYATFLYATTAIGSITQNGTTGVLYNINSDYRLKESVAPLSGGLARVNALKPSIYKWKSDGSSGEGFLAHELAEVVPAAVTGEKDAVNEDGSIKSQGIDMSRVVPILVAAIQELTARVQTLETR